MFELICLAVIGAYFWNQRKQQELRIQAETAVSRAQTANALSVPRRVLDIQGTQAFPASSAGFFKQFGVNIKFLSDARMVSGPLDNLQAAHPDVVNCTNQLYMDGNALGPELMEMVNHGRGLRADEGLFFACVQGPRVGDLKVSAFVARLPR